MITLKQIQNLRPCWSEARLEARVPAGGVSYMDIARAEDVSYSDRRWLLTNLGVRTPAGLAVVVEWAQLCAKRAKEYADADAVRAAVYAAINAANAATNAAGAAANAYYAANAYATNATAAANAAAAAPAAGAAAYAEAAAEAAHWAGDDEAVRAINDLATALEAT